MLAGGSIFMRVTINGEGKEIPDGLSVRALLDHLNIQAARVAIEYNLEVLPNTQWEATRVQPNDRIEIVHFVGGG